MRHAVIILNQHAAAGRNRSVQVDYAALILQQMGFQTEIKKTIFAGQAIHLARSATTGPSDLIIAAGGDGTVNEVVSGRLQSNSPTTPIGILPFGTGNDVAQMLGLTSVDALLHGVENQEHVTWDALSVACDSPSGRVARAAVLFAAVGFASNLLEATTPRVKRWFGPKLCYSIGFFRALANFQCPRLQVRVNDKVWDEPLVVALAANAPKAGGGIMHLAPGAKMTDGQMNISLIRAIGRFNVARQFIRLVCGTHIRHPQVQYFPATALDIEAVPAQAVSADGDLIGRTPVRIEIKPRAITFIRSSS